MDAFVCEDGEEEYPSPECLQIRMGNQPCSSSDTSSFTPLRSPSVVPSNSSKESASRKGLESAISHYLESQTKKVEDVEDGDLSFLKSLHPLLKKLPDFQKENVKMEIHALIVKAVYPPHPNASMTYALSNAFSTINYNHPFQ
jgi:hypothetical protein